MAVEHDYVCFTLTYSTTKAAACQGPLGVLFLHEFLRLVGSLTVQVVVSAVEGCDFLRRGFVYSLFDASSFA